jgi:hypothetical protein
MHFILAFLLFPRLDRPSDARLFCRRSLDLQRPAAMKTLLYQHVTGIFESIASFIGSGDCTRFSA